jgi:hypothetical protein
MICRLEEDPACTATVEATLGAEASSKGALTAVEGQLSCTVAASSPWTNFTAASE